MEPEQNLRPLHSRAIADTTELVATIGPADLSRQTPCGDWTLHDLLAHMIGQNEGFATAVLEGDAPLEAYLAPPPAPEEIASAWDRSAANLMSAFANAADESPVVLREVRPEVPFTAKDALGMQLLDTAVHAWDVATSLGKVYRPDDDIVVVVASIAEKIPDGEGRNRPGSAFAPGKPTDTTDLWSVALARLGRLNPPGAGSSTRPPRAAELARLGQLNSHRSAG